EVELRARLFRHGEAGDQRIALVVAQGIGSLIPWPSLDRTGDVDLGADTLGQVDVETDQFATRITEVEGRKIGRGEKADGRDGSEAGRDFAGARIGMIGQRLG